MKSQLTAVCGSPSSAGHQCENSSPPPHRAPFLTCLSNLCLVCQLGSLHDQPLDATHRVERKGEALCAPHGFLPGHRRLRGHLTA